MTAIKKWVSHNQALVVGIVLCVLLATFTFGCNVTTKSPFNPEEKVTRSELDIQVKSYTAEVELAYQDLEKKEVILRAIAEAGLAYASGGGVNPIGVASTMLGILGMGAVVDNRRKDAVIKSKSNALAKIGDLKTKVIKDKETNA